MILTEQYLSHRQYVRKHNISLMQLHEFNHRLLEALLPIENQQAQIHHSALNSTPLLQVKYRERFKFTTEIAMCMIFDDAVSDALVIRIYHDAQLAELVYSNEFEKQFREMGGRVDAKNQASLRYSQNCFLNKWLIYLLEKGYCQTEWQAISESSVTQR
ncbi:DUF1249 domain-containing protein [Marinicella litoralis]|uniref:Uncharacterized protein YqiB (DUF1249 family) n=1 Tax=Marinicella litoralis TaxID=644220 RepID=A0A4R6XRG4_9GAMM|nr:DUF1249 domain-containing protein [Marinicella litoralis]TDR22485.1 uncharacterized protein YqiB (DUF1249 family) [Marinicella litoralis]